VRTNPFSFPFLATAAALATLFVSGCATAPSRKAPEPTMTATLRDGPFHAYATGSVPPKTKILLVAGGSTLANFLQEVIDQREHWLRVGYRPSEIACYYVRPDVKHYLEDQEQFDAVGPKAKGFYEARPDQIYAHLAQLSREAPPFIYLYTTSHGLSPHEEMDDYTLVYDIDPVHRGPKQHRHVKPADLRDALSRLPESTAKFVVLQGCHAGGFIDSDRASYRARTLRSVPSVTVLAASRHDRTSFGCGASDDSTYYGSAYLSSLKEGTARIPDLDFADLSDRTVARVEWVEETHRIPYGKRSLPQFFTNVP